MKNNILIILLLMSSFLYASRRGYYVDYNDIAWSPDNKHIAFSFFITIDDGIPFPHEAVAYIDVDDTLAQVVVITPPIDRAFAINDSQIVCWSDRDGWVILDMNKSKIGKEIGKLYNEGVFIDEPYKIQQAPNNKILIAGMGFDDVNGKNVVICWNFENFKTVRITEDTVNAIDFFWKDSLSILCKSHINDGIDTLYIEVNERTGQSQAITHNQYEEYFKQTQIVINASDSSFVFQSENGDIKRIHSHKTFLPANPVFSWDKKYIAFDVRTANNAFVGIVDITSEVFYWLDSGWGPQFVNHNRILYHHHRGFGIADLDMNGVKKRIIYYPRTAHHPQWISESIIQFRVGRADTNPEPYYENPSVLRWPNNNDSYYLERDSQLYCHDELWQVNIKSGDIQMLPDIKPASVLRLKPWWLSEYRYRSPDGQRVIHNYIGKGLYIFDKNTQEERKLLSF